MKEVQDKSQDLGGHAFPEHTDWLRA